MISEIRVRTAKPAEKPCELTDARGLFFQVMPNGSRGREKASVEYPR